MANLWQIERQTGEWAPRSLDAGDCFVLGAGEPGRTTMGAMPAEGVRLVRYADALMGRGRWLLLAGGGARVRVNGARVQTGIHAIRDRDAIELDGEPACFFSAERLPLAEAFPASTARTLCRRCGLALEPGSPAVRCSVCEAWHHQTVELPCWAALPQCALCGAATAGEEYVWTPAQL